MSTIKFYKQEELEQAIEAAAKQNQHRDILLGLTRKRDGLEQYLEEARHLLTSAEMDYANYIPQRKKEFRIVMEKSSLYLLSKVN